MGDRALIQSLSFFRKGDVHHVPTMIRQMELGVKRFYLIGRILFDSILRLWVSKFGNGAPPHNQHEDRAGFHGLVSWGKSEEMLYCSSDCPWMESSSSGWGRGYSRALKSALGQRRR
jgi:hypothetical protein